MAAPQPAAMLPEEILNKTISLPQKPGAEIAYSLVNSTQPNPQKTTIVFLNGLMTDKSTWLPVIAGIIRQRKGTPNGIPSMLAYDRYGQGLTESRDPQDQGREKGHGHDCADAAADLHQLILAVFEQSPQRLVLVGNSIGCAIARLYAQKYPVAAILMLDSVMANSDFDIFPNPDAADFDKSQVPEDVSVEALKAQRAKLLMIFAPGTPNKEGLSRRNLATLLPKSDGPSLKGEGRQPWITVVGHDFDAFAEESFRTMGTPKSLTTRYTNPVWHQYNEGLAKLTDPKFSKGPSQAKGCGHFIQRNDPDFVVEETLDLVDKVRMEESVGW